MNIDNMRRCRRSLPFILLPLVLVLPCITLLYHLHSQPPLLFLLYPKPPVLGSRQLQLCCNHYFTPRFYKLPPVPPPPDSSCPLPSSPISDIKYTHMAANCSGFRQLRKYDRIPVNHEETTFPLAFSILMYKDVEQVERLLRAIYRPHNSYCVHVDKGASRQVFSAIQAVVKCFNNVFLVSKREKVEWAMFPVIQAEVNCMKELLKFSCSWKYFINLTGQDFPLRTNLELVHILKAYNISNDVEGSSRRFRPSYTKYHYYNATHHTDQLKSPPPGNFTLYKGSTHVVLARTFVDAIVTRPAARKLLSWMRDVLVPDELYFNTLNHNPSMAMPGAFIGNAETKGSLNRYKVWQHWTEACWGRYIREVCHFSLGDLHQVAAVPHLFANKFSLHESRLALDCIEQWYWERAMSGRVAEDFDIEFYQRQVWAHHHVHVSDDVK